ncbi:MAG: esterase [Synechococcaceae cyanobacterium]|nr:esterase [Synechococcaceae cyanobacterium]
MSPLSSPDAPRRDSDGSLRIGPRHASRRLVLLHGWGADADDLLDLGAELVGRDVSVVALRAPQPHPLGSGRQWYGLQPIDWSELPVARSGLRERLLELGEEVPLQATALLGFSQGAAIGLDVATAAGGGLPLASLIACSGYPHPDWSPDRPAMEILLTHGQQDPVVPFAASEAIEQQLRQAGGRVQRLAFSGGHGIDPDLFDPMRALLGRGWSGAEPA